MKTKSDCFCFNVRSLARAITMYYDTIIHESHIPHPIKVTQFHLLKGIKESKKSNITGIAKDMVMDRTTAVRNISPLFKAGYVTHEVNGKDNRERIIKLTEKGQRLCEAIEKDWEVANNKLMKEISESFEGDFREDCRALIKIVTKCIQEIKR